MLMAMTMALLACSGDTGTDSADIDKEPWAPVLEDPAYRFCHVEGADAEQAVEFCPLLDQLAEGSCPGLERTCNGAPPEATGADSQGCNGSGGGGTPAGLAPPPEKPLAGRDWNIDPPSCDPPQTGGDWLMALAKWGTAAVVALIVLVIIRLVLKYVGTASTTTASTPVAQKRKRAAIVQLDDVPDLPSNDLLGEAQTALSEGRHGEAILLARGASLRALGEAGRIRLHRARTDHEYQRQVRRVPELHEPLTEVLQAVEEHRWGGQSKANTEARSVLAAAERILALVVPVLMLAVLLGASGNAYRYGPQGDAGLFDLLADYDYEVSWRLRGLDSMEMGDTDVLILDLSGVTPTDDDWTALSDWVRTGGVLVVGGNSTDAFPLLGDWVQTEPSSTLPLVGAMAVTAWSPTPSWPDGPRAGWERSPNVMWVSEGSIAIVQHLRIGEGAVIAIADERLLWNGALVSPDNEIFLGNMIRLGPNNGWWDLPEDRPATVQLATMSSAGSSTPMESLFNANILAFTLQLLLLLVLGSLWKGWPFAPLKDPPHEGRKRFAEHVLALAGRYHRLGATRFAMNRYASLWLMRLGRSGLIAAAVRNGSSQSEAHGFADRIEAAAADHTGPNSPQNLKLMEELWRVTSKQTQEPR